MKSLSKNKVKVIYLEHLQTDAHQPLLDKYFKTGKMDRPLKQFLKNQDAGHQLPEGTPIPIATWYERRGVTGLK